MEPAPGTANLLFTADVSLRVEVARANSSLLMVIIQAPTAVEFGTFDPLAEKILGTLKFGP